MEKEPIVDRGKRKEASTVARVDAKNVYELYSGSEERTIVR